MVLNYFVHLLNHIKFGKLQKLNQPKMKTSQNLWAGFVARTPADVNPGRRGPEPLLSPDTATRKCAYTHTQQRLLPQWERSSGQSSFPLMDSTLVRAAVCDAVTLRLTSCKTRKDSTRQGGDNGDARRQKTPLQFLLFLLLPSNLTD